MRRRGFIYPHLIALVASAAVGIAAAQSTQALPIRELSLAEAIPFVSTPTISAMLTETKCDVKGNIYTVQSTVPPPTTGPSNLSSLPVSKLVLDAKLIVPYPVPAIDHYSGIIRTGFDVSADGTLYALLTGIDTTSTDKKSRYAFFVARYKDDGSLDSYVRMGDAPNGRVQPWRLSAFKNGNVLVTGTVALRVKCLSNLTFSWRVSNQYGDSR